jgi:hypothetical protein
LSPTFGQVALRLLASAGRNLSSARGRELDSGAARFGQSNGNGLLRGAGAMFTFANMMHLFADEFTGLCGWSFPLASVFFGAFECLLFWHNTSCGE